MRREQIKALIELSNTYDEVDEILEKYAKFTTYEEKLAYLLGMFDVELVFKEENFANNEKQNDYIALVDAIINLKWK